MLVTGRRETGNSVVFSRRTPAPPGLVMFFKISSMLVIVRCDEATFWGSRLMTYCFVDPHMTKRFEIHGIAVNFCRTTVSA